MRKIELVSKELP